MRVFIDSNIPMYVARREHPNREPARRFLEQVRDREIEGCTSTAVLFEILARYSGLGRPDLARKVHDLFVAICPVVFDLTLADTDYARELLLSAKGVAACQAVHAAVMTNRGIERIATFDRGFIAVPGIKRYELD